ncbi:hypothetical protein ACROYT_G014079 [Oculina patagonica]
MADFIKFLKLFKLHSEEDNGSITKFWRSYFEMISLMVTFIRATREGNWPLHLECIGEMLPWFLSEDWSKEEYAERIGSRVMYVTHDNHYTKLVVIDGHMTATDETELYTDQEEVDTRMFLHVKHASSHEHQRVAKVSPDTNVEVVTCHHQSTIPAELIFKSKGKKRAFEIVRECQIMNDSVQVLGESLPLSEKSITGLQKLVYVVQR